MRAIAVVLVIYSHVAFVHMTISPWFDRFSVQLGPLGVNVFFVVSGFIITHLLLQERARTGRLSLRRFYARRAIRLWPALWVYIAVVAIWHSTISNQAIVAPLAFISDYVVSTNGFDIATLHTWSLSLEEQFYLAWPLLLIVVPRRHLWKLLVVLIAAAPAIRAICYYAIPSWRSLETYQFHARYDFLAIGCLLALDYENGWRVITRLARYRLLLLPICAAVALGVVAKLADEPSANLFLFLIGYSAQALAIAILVGLCVIRGRVGVLGRALNSRLLVHIGTISYGLYLWQMLFTLVAVPPFTNPAIGLPCAAACAELSYFLLEKPLMRLRRRLRSERQLAAVPGTAEGTQPSNPLWAADRGPLVSTASPARSGSSRLIRPTGSDQATSA
jgi:peptidoglycan/LPS O-acetylase OafA/YrhL